MQHNQQNLRPEMSANFHYKALIAGEKGKIDIIYIGNIPTNTTEEEIQNLFSDVNIVGLKLISNGIKTYGLAKCSNNAEAKKAAKLYDNKPLHGRWLVVRKYENKKNNDGECQGDTSEHENNSESGNSDSKDYATKLLRPKNDHINNDSDMPELEDIRDDEMDSHHQQNTDPSNHRNKYKTKVTNKLVNNKKPKKSPNNRLIANGSDSPPSKPFKPQQHNMMEETDLNKPNRPVSLLVGNFPIGTTKGELNALFWDYSVTQIRMVNNTNPKKSTQAFLYFSNQKDLEMAIQKYDRAQYLDHTLFVAFIDPVSLYEDDKFAENRTKKLSPVSKGHFEQKFQQVNEMSSINERLRRCSVQSGGLAESSHNKADDKGTINVNRNTDRRPMPVQDQKIGQVKRKTSNNSNSNISSSSSSSSSKPQEDKPKPVEKGNYAAKNDYQKSRNIQNDEQYETEVSKLFLLLNNFNLRNEICQYTEQLEILITSISSNDLIWAQVFSKTNLKDYVELHKELQSVAPEWRRYNQSSEDRCVALYQGEWYRALIMKSSGKSHAKLFFVDFGNISNISLNDVRLSQDYIWKMLPQARVFKITGSEVSPEMENNNLTVKIIEPACQANKFIPSVKVNT